MTELIPLGIGSAIPTRDRHLSALALYREGRTVLFDCGEGTQYRLLAAGLKRSRIDVICITHFHGDHLYGLPGLVSTLALLKRREPLTIVAPEGIERIMRSLPGLANDWLPFEVRYVELAEDFEHAVVAETDAYRITARPIEHRVFAAGFRYEEKPGRGNLDVQRAHALGVTDVRHYRALKAGQAVTVDGGRTVRPEEVVIPPAPGAVFAYVADTRPCGNGRRLAEGADVVYHEATFTDDLHERAIETGHSTAREAAEVARDAGADRLLLGHFSARYKSPDPLVEEARRIFPATDAAAELQRYALRSEAAVANPSDGRA